MSAAKDTLNMRWAQDTEGAGHRMLRKLGWKEGTALGAVGREGALAPIKVIKNRENAGLGFDPAAKEAEPHADAFGAVLSALKRDFPTPPLDKEDAPAPKRQRRRYKKFADAKDVSQYSDKDLQAILGRGVL